MSERNLVTTIHLPVVQVPQSRSYGTENGGQPVSSQFARYTDDLVRSLFLLLCDCLMEVNLMARLTVVPATRHRSEGIG
jgi:hypothetical protein